MFICLYFVCIFNDLFLAVHVYRYWLVMVWYLFKLFVFILNVIFFCLSMAILYCSFNDEVSYSFFKIFLYKPLPCHDSLLHNIGFLPCICKDLKENTQIGSFSWSNKHSDFLRMCLHYLIWWWADVCVACSNQCTNHMYYLTTAHHKAGQYLA